MSGCWEAIESADLSASEWLRKRWDGEMLAIISRDTSMSKNVSGRNVLF